MRDIFKKSAFIFFLSSLTNQEQESGFQQVGGLVTRNISAFCLQRVALYFRAIPSSIDFSKGIFLNVIPARIVVSWLDSSFISLRFVGTKRWVFFQRSNEEKCIFLYIFLQIKPFRVQKIEASSFTEKYNFQKIL